MARDPLHTFRAPPELWLAVQQAADENGDTMSEILRRALETYRDENAGAYASSSARAGQSQR